MLQKHLRPLSLPAPDRCNTEPERHCLHKSPSSARSENGKRTPCADLGFFRSAHILVAASNARSRGRQSAPSSPVGAKSSADSRRRLRGYAPRAAQFGTGPLGVVTALRERPRMSALRLPGGGGLEKSKMRTCQPITNAPCVFNLPGASSACRAPWPRGRRSPPAARRRGG